MTTPNALSLPLLENKLQPESDSTTILLNNGWNLEIYKDYRYTDDLTLDVAYDWQDDEDDSDAYEEELWEEDGELVLYCGPTERGDGGRNRLCDSLDVYSYLEQILPWASIGDAENYHTVDRTEMELALGEELTVRQAKAHIVEILEKHGCVPF